VKPVFFIRPKPSPGCANSELFKKLFSNWWKFACFLPPVDYIFLPLNLERSPCSLRVDDDSMLRFFFFPRKFSSLCFRLDKTPPPDPTFPCLLIAHFKQKFLPPEFASSKSPFFLRPFLKYGSAAWVPSSGPVNRRAQWPFPHFSLPRSSLLMIRAGLFFFFYYQSFSHSADPLPPH